MFLPPDDANLLNRLNFYLRRLVMVLIFNVKLNRSSIRRF
jgi:hypothetical protein